MHLRLFLTDFVHIYDLIFTHIFSAFRHEFSRFVPHVDNAAARTRPHSGIGGARYPRSHPSTPYAPHVGADSKNPDEDLWDQQQLTGGECSVVWCSVV